MYSCDASILAVRLSLSNHVPSGPDRDPLADVRILAPGSISVRHSAAIILIGCRSRE